MPSQILRRGVNDEVNAHCERFATPRRSESVVNDQQKIMTLGHLNHGLDITHLEDRIGQGLDVEKFRVVLNGGFVGQRVSHIGHCCGKTKAEVPR